MEQILRMEQNNMPREDSILSLLGRIVLGDDYFQVPTMEETESDDEEMPELEDPPQIAGYATDERFYPFMTQGVPIQNPIEQWTLEGVESDEDEILPFPSINDSPYVTLEEWSEGQDGMLKTVDIGFSRNYTAEEFWVYDPIYHF